MDPRARYLPAGERRAATIEAVVELAARENPEDITTTAIARHMHLTQGALFRHFPSKDAIFEAVMGWVAEKLLGRLDEAAASATSPLHALEAMFLAHADFVAEHPGVPRLLFGQLQRAEDTVPKRLARTLIARYGERLQALLAAGRAAGHIAPDLDAEAAAAAFIGALQGLVMQSMLAGDMARVRTAAPGAFAIWRRGVEARP
jgi:AcrR family transcriptional regulator